MARDTSLRWLVRLVAAPFLIGGGLAVVAAFGAPLDAQSPLLLGLLNCAVGVGLLLRRPISRTAALIVLALQLAGTISLGTMRFSTDSSLTLDLLNRAVHISGGVGVLLLAALGGIEVAGLVILSRPSVRGAFATHT